MAFGEIVFVCFAATLARAITLWCGTTEQFRTTTPRHRRRFVLYDDVQSDCISTGKETSMSLEGQYEASPSQWVRDQVELYERTAGAEGNTLRDTGLPIVIVTTRGNKSGKIRKTPLMRVEHGGEYALVASQGGAPTHPVWYYNLTADPDSVTIQDGATPFAVTVREIEGDERAVWWERAVAAFPPYAQYQLKTERRIPVFLATKKS
jgi:deazaflavin-dependent oxidoreductase (nitroreductase family)